ncbi:MAG: iron-sulfur cluster insertion protein ErpA [Rhodospirillaceae bacterium]|nr:MAG: iron-sulfur cluster insertion protein ErpA [Rhodospirillaceae bacterium]
MEHAPVTISQSAARRIAELLSAEAEVGHRLRIAVTGGGCSGFQYNFTFDNVTNDDDVVIEKNGASIVIDAISREYLAGAEVDFVEDLIGSAFAIRNPNATASCGCGNSFSVN